MPDAHRDDEARREAPSPFAQLHDFRATHPANRTCIAGVAWEYIVCGQGEQTLLLLPGAPGRGETAFQHILALEDTYRIIAPSYPPQPRTVAEMLHGLAGIMQAEGVAKAHLVGGSYSGLIAQSFVRRFPDKVATLILSDTGVPGKARATRYSRNLRLLKAMPLPAIHALWRLGAYLYLREIVTDKAFWRAYFRELIVTITKEECLGRLSAWIDFDRHSRFTPRDLQAWRGRILILEANSDSTFPPQERAALRRLYPQAKVLTFEGGHATSLARRSDYITAIAGFLANKP